MHLQTQRFTPRVSKRSTQGPLDEDRAIVQALRGMAGVDMVQPIFFGGRLVAWAKGETWSREVTWRPAMPGEKWDCTNSTYDALMNSIASGKKWSMNWSKSNTTAPVAGQIMDLWPVGGNPASGTYPGTAYTARQLDDTTTGAIYHGGNQSPDIKNLIMIHGLVTAGVFTAYLYDRCLTYEGCSFNANVNQAMTNTLTLQRYQAAGEGGCKIMVTGQTVLGATAANITQLRYTDQDGNTLQSMPTSPTIATIVSAAAPTGTLGARVIAPAVGANPIGPYLPLAAGDGGARLINDFTTSAANTGTICFALVRPLAVLTIPFADTTSMIDLVQQVAGYERIRDGACLSIFGYNQSATAFTIMGGTDCAWG